MIATRDLVNIESGEIKEVNFLNFKDFRMIWQLTICNYLLKKKFISETEYNFFITKFKNGFHAYFKPIENITSNSNQSDNILFKVAEYLATNVLHNSQLSKFDSENQTITFCFKSWVDRKTKEKTFKEVKLNVFDFMAKLLYFLPAKHEKTIRYYGLYVRPSKKLENEYKYNSNWSAGIQHLYETQPELCPVCNGEMSVTIIFSEFASKIVRKMRANFFIKNGYFYPKTRPP